MEQNNSRKQSTLKSVTHLLNASQLRGGKQTRKITSKTDSFMEKIRPGRHKCDCQARVHGLILNCLECGRVVCEQEGSGPCFFCGNLVCSREERQIIEAGTPESKRLISKLMDDTIGSNKASWGHVSRHLVEAEAYRDKLLAADADCEKRNRVNDLESNYFTMENDIFLTKEEREAIIARKEELRDIRAKKKRLVIVDVSLTDNSVSEVVDTDSSLDKDPVIQAIFKKAHQRQHENRASIHARWVPKGFVPQYDEKTGRRSKAVAADEDSDVEDIFFSQFNELMYSEVERKGFAFALDQPVASLLAVGIRRHIPWFEDVYLRGPVLIAASVNRPSDKAIEEEVVRCRNRMALSSYSKQRDFPLSYPTGAIVGRVLLVDCLTLEEYRQQYVNGEFEGFLEGFVLIFSSFEPLLVPVPHIAPSPDFYRIDKVLRKAVKQILDPYSLS